MKIIKVTNIEKFVAKNTPKQPQKNKSIVESILKNVQKNGDSAIKKYEKKFGGATLTSLRVSESEIKNAYSKISKSELDSISFTKKRLEKTEKTIKSILKNKTIKHNGVKISKKYDSLYEVKQSEMPADIQTMIDNNEIGAALLRIIEVIGPDKIENIDEDTVYFIINTLNQLNVDLIRNKLLLKVLPLKV